MHGQPAATAAAAAAAVLDAGSSLDVDGLAQEIRLGDFVL